LLSGFLLALGVSPSSIPSDEDSRERLYRSMLSEERALIVLDNAMNEAQVRPLIPGSSTCSVLITSRYELSGLVGMTSISLDELYRDDGVALLEHLVGSDRVAKDQETAGQIVSLCGGLPVAIEVAGRILASRPKWSLAKLKDRLVDERVRLGGWCSLLGYRSSAG
jgi:hypothetical protein